MVKHCACWFVAMFVVAACAMGDIPHEGIDASTKHDAHFVVGDSKQFDDAALHDAKVFMDAAPMIDAGAGGGFCTLNHECPVHSECCFVALCVPGTRVGDNICLPH
jgi:hypothetical protein